MAIQYVGEVTSTNTLLKQMALDGAPDGTVLVADRQTGGHGRFGRAFFSPDGGLYMSVLLRRKIPTEEVCLLTVAAATAAAEAAESLCGQSVAIKWVNDLYLNGKKVCGILAEAMTDPVSGESATVVGFGVNIAPPQGGFPHELQAVAGALLPKSRADARDVLAKEIASRFLRYAADLPARAYLAGYRARMLLQGREITYLEGEQSRRATVLGVDDDGALLVRAADGKEHRLSYGEVTMHFSTGE